MSDLSDELAKLEFCMYDNNFRNSREKLETIISKEFIEYGSTGAIFNHDTVMDFLVGDSNSTTVHKIVEKEIKQLSENVVLLLYKMESLNTDKTIRKTIRSSVWENKNGHWKILFHQGTVAK